MTETNRNLKSRMFSIGGLVAVFIIIILVNVLFARVNLRVDVTEDKLYSLSEGTHELLNNLERGVNIKFFYSQSIQNFPAHLKIYANRVIDFLSEYEFHSGKKIMVEMHDPKPDSEEEEWAQRYGMEGITLPTGETVYMGLVAMSADQEEAIAFLDPTREERLEYDLTRMISRVQSLKNQKIGIISGLPVFSEMPANPAMSRRPSEPWYFVKELQDAYEVIQIKTTDETIPDDLDLLVIIHPKDLSEILEFAIDQYVLKGGNALIFVDPFSTRDISAQHQLSSSSLDRLFKAWGISMIPDKAVIDFDFPTGLRVQNNQVESNPSWLSLSEEAINRNALITSQLNSMILPVAGAIEKSADADIQYEPLVQSSTNASLENTFKLRFGIEEIRREFKPAGKKFDLAVKIEGNFTSAFPDGKPEKRPNENSSGNELAKTSATGQNLKESTSEAILVVVSDTDLLWDDYYLSKQNFLGMQLVNFFNDNLNFFQNASEMLSGSNELIHIRSRGKFDRPFTRVQMLEKKAASQWLEQEQQLLGKVEETNQKLRELEKMKDASQKFVLSREQEEEIQKFRDEKLRINQELKLVRRHLRSDIESLGTRVKFINIFLMPLLVSIAGIGYALYNRKKSLQG
ncbi:MAG: GldG family protein [Desulfobacterales bacterium]